MNRWGREEWSSSPPTRRIAGRIWASSTCSPTRFCTSTIFRSERGGAIPRELQPGLPLSETFKKYRLLSLVSGALEFFVTAFLRDPNRSQVLRMDQTHRPCRAEALVAPGDHCANGFRRIAPVSYTHLRAHATDSYLVCRL